MNCIVIDDEPLARQGMELMIKEVRELYMAGSFSNVLDADNYLRHHQVDLIFLDINMPRISGIDYLRSQDIKAQVIITTAYPQYALEGFDLDVADYLVKPVRLERFYKAVKKALKNFQGQNDNSKQPLEIDDNYVFVRADKKFVRVNLAEVLYIEALKDYVVLHVPPEKIMIAVNLRTIQVQLPRSMFMRINKSFLINLTRIKSVDNNSVFIGNEEIPVGDTYKDNLMKHIRNTGVIKRY